MAGHAASAYTAHAVAGRVVRRSDAAGDCARFWELAAEFALGLVTGHERNRALAHLQRCPACCWHTARLAAVCDRLRGLIRSTEAPVGFEQRVLQRREATEAPNAPGSRAGFVRRRPR